MPDRGLLAPSAVTPAVLHGEAAQWVLEGARAAQITFEVEQSAALESMPTDVGRPVPCYARLFILEAPASPAGELRLAALMVGGRFRMLPRNVLVQGVVDGDLAAVERALGSPWVAGKVELGRPGPELTATVAAEAGLLARLVIPRMHAIEPTMLRWDPWLGYASQEGKAWIIEYGPRPEPSSAFLGKGAVLDTPAGLARENPWRRLRNLNTVSACYIEGDIPLTAPAVQQVLQ